ncbi:hypothetical protein FJZ48_01805 [Candidatus Uhrbacteria bacterium]|nr:hypothetical protein [Candidatus Uhrbacteria bacterium]
MRRSFSIVIWILIGAIASGVGIGFFLHQANTDRVKLVQQTNQAKAEVELAKKQSVQVTEEANAKLAAAEKDLKTQLERVRQERKLFSQAVPLRPSATITKYWNTNLSLPLGISIQSPTNYLVNTSSSGLLALNHPYNDLVLNVAPYSSGREYELQQILSNTSTVVYLIDEHLVHGWIGTGTEPYGSDFVLRAQTDGTASHLLWGRIRSDAIRKTLNDILSSLDFRS